MVINYGELMPYLLRRPIAVLVLATLAARRLRLPLNGLALLVTALVCVAEFRVLAQGTSQERDFLTRIRRLTVEGRRAGEGYWSKDGTKLVFQSEREPGNPFYQIYLMDLSSGEVSRVSPGMGKTTCSFINPVTGDIEFASTHHDPTSKQQQADELKFRASGQERRYSWDYDPEMEIYIRNAKTGMYKRMTNARGYDAEGSYSPDGQWIVFSSTRQAYGRQLSPAEQKQLESDPSYFAEIYIMRADGSGQTRLTNNPELDFQPALSPDRSEILFTSRRDSDLELFLMNRDGSNVRRLTSNTALDADPAWSPDGTRIAFASNRRGNQQIFVMDADGGHVVPIVHPAGRATAPAWAPDGRALYFPVCTRTDGVTGCEIFAAHVR